MVESAKPLTDCLLPFPKLLAPPTIENSSCHQCSQVKSGCPSGFVNTDHDVRGKSEPMHKWGSSPLCYICEWPRSSHGTMPKCISNSTWTTKNGFTDGAGWGCACDILAEYWRGNEESGCFDRPLSPKAFVTSSSDPQMCCMYNRDMNQCKGI